MISAHLLIFAAFLLGILVRYLIPKHTWLKIIVNKFLIYIGLPLLIYFAIERAHFIDVARYMLIIAVLLVIGFIILYYVVKQFKMKGKEKASLFQSLTIGNVAYLGIPFSGMLFGDLGIVLAGLFSFLSMISHYSYILLMSQSFVSKKKTFFAFMKKPFVWILLLVFILSQVNLPHSDTLANLSKISIYLAVFIVGISLNFSTFTKKDFSYVWIKLLALPLLALPLFLFMETNTVLAFMFLLAMPSAFSNTSVCIEFGFDEEIASRQTSLGTIIFFIIMGVGMLIAGLI